MRAFLSNMSIIDNFNEEAEAKARRLTTNKEPKPKKEVKPKAKKESEDEKFNQALWLWEKLQGLFSRCAISGRIYQNDTGEELTEHRANSLLLNLKMEAQALSSETFFTYLNSEEIKERNYVVEYLDSLEFRGDCIKRLYDCLLLKEPSLSEKFYTIFRKWLIGAVAQVWKLQFFPNVLCPILVSPIFTGKTSFFKKLHFGTPLDAYATLQQIGAFDKDTQTVFAQYFLICADEISKNDLKQNSAFRRLVSAVKFNFRAPYARNFTQKNRIASLCGTTNETDLIVDAENNRRIVPIEITAIDFEELNKIEAHDIWASAVNAYKNEETYDLTIEEVKFIQGISTEYAPVSGLSDFLSSFIRPCEKPAPRTQDNELQDKGIYFMSSPEMYAKWVADDAVYSKHYSPDKFALVLKEMGFRYDARKTAGKVKKGYWLQMI
jgi:hypothetical protein